jgi:hypothetical protein
MEMTVNNRKLCEWYLKKIKRDYTPSDLTNFLISIHTEPQKIVNIIRSDIEDIGEDAAKEIGAIMINHETTPELFVLYLKEHLRI